MPSLFEIADEYRQNFIALIEMEGVDETTVNDTLEAMEGDFQIKAINVAAFFQNMEAEAAAIKDAEQRMAQRRKALENKADRMRDYLKSNMLATGITKIECPYFSVSVSKSADKVIIENEVEIPEEYIRVKVLREPDKTAIKAAGGCPGARLEHAWLLRIR